MSNADIYKRVALGNVVWITPKHSMSFIDIVSAKPWTLLLRKCGVGVRGGSSQKLFLLSQLQASCNHHCYRCFKIAMHPQIGIGSARRCPWWIDVKLWTTFESLLGTWWQSCRCWGGGIYEAEYHGWKWPQLSTKNLSKSDAKICKDVEFFATLLSLWLKKTLGKLGFLVSGYRHYDGAGHLADSAGQTKISDSWQAWLVTSDSKRFFYVFFFGMMVSVFVLWNGDSWWWNGVTSCPLTKNLSVWPVSLTGMVKVVSLYSDLQDWPGRNARSSLLSGGKWGKLTNFFWKENSWVIGVKTPKMDGENNGKPY